MAATRAFVLQLAIAVCLVSLVTLTSATAPGYRRWSLLQQASDGNATNTSSPAPVPLTPPLRINASVTLPPAAPVPAPFPSREEVVSRKGPAYNYDGNNLYILWLLPPVYGLTQQQAYPPVTVKCGARVDAFWAEPIPHNMWLLSANECPSEPAERTGSVLYNLVPTRNVAQLDPYLTSEKRSALTSSNGSKYIICSVDAHCQQGMNLEIIVQGC